MGEARRGAPWAGSSGNGVNRPGPSPTSPPSGGSGPGVGLGEVLQGPKGRLLAQRGAGALGSSGGPPRGPLWGTNRMEERIRWYPRRSGPRTGARWPRVASGRPVSPPAFPRALRSQAGGAPSTIRRAPPRPCRAGSAHTWRPSRRPPHRLGPRCPACSTARPRLLRRRCSHCGRGTLVVGAGPWARIAPGVDHGEGTPPKARARRPLDGPGAHRVGDLRGSFPRSGPHRSWTPGGGGYRAPSCPRRTS